ncbi:putative flippase GtrA [Ammoniphilus resinae]|uniref:Flippase GtrA n=2 Tax=Ammoniphilus resinae TaxID=861532 RepID=A0ABS4GWX9_9BACL|nr:putative flippase GtrA [Ammoniphilus resinae]
MKQEIDQGTSLMKYISNEFFRFVLVGILNTAATYIIYLLFLYLFNHNISYTIAYILGILIGYFLNSKITFRVELTLKKFIQFPLVYLIQYLINLVMLNVLIFNLDVDKRIAPLLVIIISIPITFILSKVILKR